MDVPPHPSPSLSGLGRLIPSAGPSMLWVTITHIHVTPGPLPPLPRAGGSRRCFCWPRWAAPARPLSSGRLSAPGMDNGALCASARPRRAGPGMGLAAERRVSLLSRFKGMRGEGKRGEPRCLPRREGRALCPGAGMRWELSAARGCAGGSAGLSAVSLAGTVPGQQPRPATRSCAEGLTGSSDAPGRGQRWSGEGPGWAGRELQLGSHP